MNEQELKEIWKSGDAKDLENINFEAVQKNVIAWQGKLHQKIKVDIFTNILIYIVLIPFFYILPKLLYLTPLFAIVWIWYLWELLRIYKLETTASGSEDTKLHLEKKKNYLKNYIFRTRLILYGSTPFILFVTLWIFIGLKAIVEHSVTMIISIILLEILIIIICEIYVRLVYSPSVLKLTELLKQLETDT